MKDIQKTFYTVHPHARYSQYNLLYSTLFLRCVTPLQNPLCLFHLAQELCFFQKLLGASDHIHLLLHLGIIIFFQNHRTSWLLENMFVPSGDEKRLLKPSKQTQLPLGRELNWNCFSKSKPDVMESLISDTSQKHPSFCVIITHSLFIYLNE